MHAALVVLRTFEADENGKVGKDITPAIVWLGDACSLSKDSLSKDWITLYGNMFEQICCYPRRHCRGSNNEFGAGDHALMLPDVMCAEKRMQV